jgi:hypothetical protein
LHEGWTTPWCILFPLNSFRFSFVCFSYLQVLFCLLLLIVPFAVHVKRWAFPAAVRPTESTAAIQSHLRPLSVPLRRPAIGQLIVSSPQSRATIVTLPGWTRHHVSRPAVGVVHFAFQA